MHHPDFRQHGHMRIGRLRALLLLAALVTSCGDAAPEIQAARFELLQSDTSERSFLQLFDVCPPCFNPTLPSPLRGSLELVLLTQSDVESEYLLRDLVADDGSLVSVAVRSVGNGSLVIHRAPTGDEAVTRLVVDVITDRTAPVARRRTVTFASTTPLAGSIASGELFPATLDIDLRREDLRVDDVQRMRLRLVARRVDEQD